jgi:hypothetical protein
VSSFLTFLLFVHVPVALAEPAASVLAQQEKVQATLLGVDASKSEVTYLSASGGTRTSPVASQEALVKLVKMRGGQKVVLTCRTEPATGQCIVEDARKKPNWLKRSLILVAVVVTFGVMVNSIGTL